MLMLLVNADVLLLIIFAASVQKCFLNFIVIVIENFNNKIFTIVYIHKIL